MNKEILRKIGGERILQDTKWGVQDHSPLTWNAILLEEVGESAKAILEGSARRYREEMIQIAAVAVAALESHERGNFENWDPVTELQRKLKKAQKEIESLKEQISRTGISQKEKKNED